MRSIKFEHSARLVAVNQVWQYTLRTNMEKSSNVLSEIIKVQMKSKLDCIPKISTRILHTIVMNVIQS